MTTLPSSPRRPDPAATGFGRVATIRPPARLSTFNGLQANVSRGHLSIVALAVQTGTGSSPAYFFAQIKI